MSLAAFFDALRQLGPRYVVVTDGRNGAFLGTPEAIHFCPALETKVMGTAGAGDAFNATFTAYIALGHKPEDALRAAAVNAAVGGAARRHPDRSALRTRRIVRELAAHADQLPVRTWSH